MVIGTVFESALESVHLWVLLTAIGSEMATDISVRSLRLAKR